jgi:hypothetical protein
VFLNSNHIEESEEIESLKVTIKMMKEKAAAEKQMRAELFVKMETVSESSKCNLEKLAQSLQMIKQRRLPKCWFGINCQRLFCPFDHSNLFKKDNRIANSNENDLRFCMIYFVINVD